MLKWVCLAAVLAGCGAPMGAHDEYSTAGGPAELTEAGAAGQEAETPSAGAPSGGAAGRTTVVETCRSCSHNEGGGGTGGALRMAGGAGGAVAAAGSPTVEAGTGGAAPLEGVPRAPWVQQPGASPPPPGAVADYGCPLTLDIIRAGVMCDQLLYPKSCNYAADGASLWNVNGLASNVCSCSPAVGPRFYCVTDGIKQWCSDAGC